MAYLSDIEIAQQCQMQHITKIAEKAEVLKYIEQYGNYKAKIDLSLLADAKDKKDGKLVLVTAITPTPAGEGKTTIFKLILGIIKSSLNFAFTLMPWEQET